MLTPNTILQNRYQIIRQLGQGGMGTVYEAKALRLKTIVALKETNFTDEQLRKQFELEAQLLANLHHPALPRVFDHFDEGDGLFLVMDFIKGKDLWERLQMSGAAFPLDEVLTWADQLLDALDYLHSQEPPVIHRDIKPQNLKLSHTGQIILLDFGLAKGFAGQISRVAAPGSILGFTPNYAPLEQIQGAGTDPRSDLYSLAVTIYHLMTGVMPPDVLTRLTAITDRQPDPLRPAHEIDQNIPVGVSDVLNRGMAISKNQRPANATEMRRLLREASPQLTDENINERKRKSSQPTLITPPVQTPLEPEPEPAPRGSDHPLASAQAPPPTVASPTILSLNSTVAPASPPAAPYTSAPLARSAKRPNSLLWVVAILAAIVGVGVIISFVTRNSSVNDSPSVKIGVFMSLTGSTASFGIASVNGIKMATDEANAQGGILGKQIELLVQDDRSDAQEAATIVTRFVKQDGVHAILSEVASSRSIAAAPIAQNAKIPMVSPSSTNPEVTRKGDYIFRTCFTDPIQGAAIGEFAAKNLNAKRAGLLIDRRNDYSVGLGQFIRDTFTKLGGQIVVEQSYQEGDTDFNGQLTSIKAQNPDVIFVPGYYGEVGLIAQQAKKLGINAPLLGGDGWDSQQLWQIGGQALIGDIFSNHYSVDDPDPAVAKFVNDYKTRFGSVPDALAANAYDATRILFDAIKRAGSTEGSKIRDALLQTKNFPGVTGVVTINSERNAVKPIVMIKIGEGGKYNVAGRVTPKG